MPRQKLNRTNLHARVDTKTPESLKQLAYSLKYIYDNQGSTGQLLDAIASQEHFIGCLVAGAQRTLKIELLLKF